MCDLSTAREIYLSTRLASLLIKQILHLFPFGFLILPTPTTDTLFLSPFIHNVPVYNSQLSWNRCVGRGGESHPNPGYCTRLDLSQVGQPKTLTQPQARPPATHHALIPTKYR